MTKAHYEDGIYDISNEQYHAADAISRSKLIILDKSPFHFWYEVYSGDAPKNDPTPAMNIGSAFHTLLLEPNLFNQQYAVLPKVDRRTTKGKEQYEIFITENMGKIVLTEDQFGELNSMISHVRKHDIVNTLLEGAEFEKSIFWTDEETGLQFKSRPDILQSQMVVDLKTTNDASNHIFMRSAYNYGYYLQAGMAYEACKSIGRPLDNFSILAIEKQAPHVPSVFVMDKDAIQFGINQFNAYKMKLKKCLESNNWPAYMIQELSVPGYATIIE